MALPPLHSPVWLNLARGGLDSIVTDNLGTQLMKKRLQLSSAPATEKALEIYNFFVKWERGLGNEIAQLK
jgi:hypothetical protein